jgi:hypothetical protein
MTTCCFFKVTRLESGRFFFFNFFKKETFPSTKLTRTFGSKKCKGMMEK